MINSIASLPIRDTLGTQAPTRVSGFRAAEIGGTPEITTDFSAMISEAVTSLAQQLRKAEAVSIAGMKGTASMQDMVEQVMAAEQTLQATIAVRDKVVAAYLEISRMPI